MSGVVATAKVGLPSEWQQLGFLPGAAVRLFGMRRSGNHAIASWLQRNAPNGRSVFLNNCKPGSNPLQNFRGMELDGQHAPQRKAMRNMASVTAEAGEGALFLVSYEDTTPAEMKPGKMISGSFDETLFSANVLIFRSFLNWSASLLKKMQPNEGYSLVRRNAILLRAIDTYTRLLGLAAQYRELGLVCICYDKWMASAEHRSDLLRQLGLAERDNSLGEVQRYGGGSSFQKDATSVEDLQTDLRWQQMVKDPEYQAILHLAARDRALTRQLEDFFPQDAEYLERLGHQMPYSREELS